MSPAEAVIVENRVIISAANGRSVVDIARAHQVGLSTVREILERRGWDVPVDPERVPHWRGIAGSVPKVRKGGTGRAPREPGTLSERELAVLAAIADGLTDEQIAARDNVSRDTIRSQMAAVYKRLGARNRPHAVALAFRAGFLR